MLVYGRFHTMTVLVIVIVATTTAVAAIKHQTRSAWIPRHVIDVIRTIPVIGVHMIVPVMRLGVCTDV